MRPLLVYLDTQDYINAFNRPKGNESKIIDALNLMRNAGTIEIGYSGCIVWEFVTEPGDGFRRERMDRGRFLREVCDGKAFPYFTDINRGARFPNSGTWMPIDAIKQLSPQNIEKMLSEKIKEGLASIPNLTRNQRRFYQKKKNLFSILKKLNPCWGMRREDFGDIPVTDRIIERKVFSKYMTGQISGTEMSRELTNWFSDPEQFSEIYYTYSSKKNPIVEFFGHNLDRMQDAFNRFIIASSELRSIHDSASAQKLELRRRLLNSGIPKNKAVSLTKIEALWRPNLDFDVSKFEEICGNNRGGHLAWYLEKILRGSFEFARSDFMDLMHLVYAYDCDAFRCDKKMFNIMAGYEPFRGRLVAKIEEIPGVIQAKVSALKMRPA